jgi:hypothetical protein
LECAQEPSAALQAEVQRLLRWTAIGACDGDETKRAIEKFQPDTSRHLYPRSARAGPATGTASTHDELVMPTSE